MTADARRYERRPLREAWSGMPPAARVAAVVFAGLAVAVFTSPLWVPLV